MTSDNRVFFVTLLFAALIHFGGVFVIQIKEIMLPSWDTFQVFIYEDVFVTKMSPPSTSTDQMNSIPSFVSLPESSYLLGENADFMLDKIKLYRMPEEDVFFKEAKKMIDEEAFYFGSQLETESFLPLSENQRSYQFLLLNDTEDEQTVQEKFKLIYQGRNKVEIEKKYFFIKETLEQFKDPPPHDLVLIASFNNTNELVNCQVDLSSGNPNFDQEVLRILKSTIVPMRKQEVHYRGQFIIKFLKKTG